MIGQLQHMIEQNLFADHLDRPYKFFTFDLCTFTHTLECAFEILIGQKLIIMIGPLISL